MAEYHSNSVDTKLMKVRLKYFRLESYIGIVSNHILVILRIMLNLRLKNHAVAYLLKLCVLIVFGAKMTTSEHRSFAVERRKADRGDQSLGMSAALGRITVLEKTLSNKFDDGFTKLCDRLDVIVEDDSGASVESIMA